MPNAENAKLEYEAGQSSTPMSALTDSGDRQLFNSSASLFSKRSGYEPDVRPNGLATGGVVSAAVSASNDVVDVAALTCYLAGVKTSVSAGLDTAITRAVTNVACINSITINNVGAIAVVKGTDSADTSFSETRGAAGGPPYIPVGSIEIAQVRVTTNTTGVVAASEIFQVTNLHTERYNFPLWSTVNEDGNVQFDSALPAVHTGDAAKAVYASYAEPLFAEVESSDFVPAETTHSSSSTQIYGKVKGSSSKSLGQGSFTAYTQDGVTDGIIGLKDENLWFRFYPDKYKAPYILTQGKLGISRTFPAGADIGAACTITAEVASVEVES